jgi:hypothetical protein
VAWQPDLCQVRFGATAITPRAALLSTVRDDVPDGAAHTDRGWCMWKFRF